MRGARRTSAHGHAMLAAVQMLTLVSAATSAKKTTAQSRIEHVVLLLMENRPFDHFYGFAQPFLQGKIDGLTGNECFPTKSLRKGDTPHWVPAEEIERIGETDDDDHDDDHDDEDGDDDGDDDDGAKVKAANMPTWGLDPAHPLDGKTQILFNTFINGGKHEDKFVSFAYSATPPGESERDRIRPSLLALAEALSEGTWTLRAARSNPPWRGR